MASRAGDGESRAKEERVGWSQKPKVPKAGEQRCPEGRDNERGGEEANHGRKARRNRQRRGRYEARATTNDPRCVPERVGVSTEEEWTRSPRRRRGGGQGAENKPSGRRNGGKHARE